MEKIITREVSYPFLTKPLKVIERENGHKIILAHKEGELVNVATWVNTGSINEDDNINGISHFVEHVMFKGTKKHEAGYMDKFLEGHGGIVNAATGKDYTFYYVTIPRGENYQNLYNLIDLHADMMLNPEFPEHELGEPFDVKNDKPIQKRERHVVIEEINMYNDMPWSKVYNLMNSLLYKTHPYKREVIGTSEIISSITRDTVHKYYQKHYTPNNMITILVGDFDAEDIIKRVINAFDFGNRNCTPSVKYENEEQCNTARYEEQTSNTTTGFLITGYIGAKASDLKNDIMLNMLSIILGSGQSSGLYRNLIEKPDKPLFNFIATDYCQFRDGSNFLIQANFKPEAKNEVLKSIFDEVEKIKENIGANELKKAKNKIKLMFAQNSETVSDISDNIGQYSILCKDISLANEYLKLIDTVTIDELKQTARKYLKKEFSATAVLLPDNINGEKNE